MLIFHQKITNKSGSETVYELMRKAFSSICTDSFPEIAKTKNGKPYFPSKPDLHFSLSHTKSHVLCAISNNPIGCDIEPLDREISGKALEYFATPEELSQFNPLDLWVLKESYVKLFGLTFASIRHLRFSRNADKIILPDPNITARLYIIDGCRAAVCAFEKDFPESSELI